MTYHARHRQVADVRRRARTAAGVAALTASLLVVPVVTTTPSEVHADTVATVSEAWPQWLKAHDIAINPAGPKAGDVDAPAVLRGYAITGDALAKYDITATLAGQREVAEFTQRLQTTAGAVAVSPTGYRVYSLPPIDLAVIADALKEAGTLVAWLQTTNPPDLGTDDLAALLQQATTALDTAIETARKQQVYVEGTDDVNAALGLVVGAAGLALSKVEDALATVRNADPDPTVAAVRAAVDYALATVQQINVDALMESLGLSGPTEIGTNPVGAAPVGPGDLLALVTEGDNGIGDVLVLPTGATVELVGAAWDEGMLRVTTVLSAHPTLAAIGHSLPQQPAQSDELGEQWRPAGGFGCVSRKSNNTAWYDPCSFFYEHSADGNNDRQTWGLVQFGTGKSKGTWLLRNLEVRSWPVKDTASQAWMNWAPGADTDAGNCVTTTAG
ncbi:MAG TPA: hypothetical protein VF711_04700, partial [Acidimicrobiales bacterium]